MQTNWSQPQSPRASRCKGGGGITIYTKNCTTYSICQKTWKQRLHGTEVGETWIVPRGLYLQDMSSLLSQTCYGRPLEGYVGTVFHASGIVTIGLLAQHSAGKFAMKEAKFKSWFFLTCAKITLARNHRTARRFQAWNSMPWCNQIANLGSMRWVGLPSRILQHGNTPAGWKIILFTMLLLKKKRAKLVTDTRAIANILFFKQGFAYMILAWVDRMGRISTWTRHRFLVQSERWKQTFWHQSCLSIKNQILHNKCSFSRTSYATNMFPNTKRNLLWKECCLHNILHEKPSFW